MNRQQNNPGYDVILLQGYSGSGAGLLKSGAYVAEGSKKEQASYPTEILFIKTIFGFEV